MAQINGDVKNLYLCNPTKNTTCKKTWCFYTTIAGECMYTTNPEYSLDGVAYSLNELKEYEKKRAGATKV